MEHSLYIPDHRDWKSKQAIGLLLFIGYFSIFRNGLRGFVSSLGLTLGHYQKINPNKMQVQKIFSRIDLNKIRVKLTLLKDFSLKIVLILIFCCFSEMQLSAQCTQVTGTVFRDYNANGVQDAGEPGFEGLTVTVYDSLGTAYPSASGILTDANGGYTVSGLNDSYRVEFSGFPAWLQSVPFASGNSESRVQFVGGSTCTANLGVNDPVDYCANASALITHLPILNARFHSGRRHCR